MIEAFGDVRAPDLLEALTERCPRRQSAAGIDLCGAIYVPENRPR